MAVKKISIKETANVFDDGLLDVIGNEFKFDHVKGMAEWLKNSVDAYRREDVSYAEQHVVFKFIDKGVPKPVVECIDFVGMEKPDIENAFKRWGDPNAAKRGAKIKVYGGHGNGGKFYMRQMFAESRFITYKKGILNIFGFSDNRKYGYAEGYENKKMTPKEAMAFAELDSLPVPLEIKEKMLNGKTGFTVIHGVGPEGVRGRFKIERDMERFKNHPQARRILLHASVSVVYNGASLFGLLKPDELAPLEKFEIPRDIPVPASLPSASDGDKTQVKMSNEKYSTGRLILKTSAEAMARGSKQGELNRIDILGEIGVIGSYQLYELGVTGFPHAAFIYGECEVPILEDPSNDCVSNDRAKLVKNETTEALLAWVAKEIDKLAAEIAALEREKHKASQKEITSKFNDVLNQWKNKHMKKIISELFGGDSGSAPGGSNGGFSGTEVTPPLNGFDFKYPQAEIQIETPAKVTLKVGVPGALPIGATIYVSSDNDSVILEDEKYHIKSDYLKTTPDGEEIAFINVDVVGQKLGEAIVTAKAGKLSAMIKIKVIEKKENQKSGRAFPRVLLSGHDKDPLNLAPDGFVFLGEREPVVYQRPQDVPQSIYWINTSSPMASKIYEKFSFNSIQWRNFLFERYVDIFVKESIHELARQDLVNFTADAVDQKIAEVIRKVHQSAKEDLDQFLFEESYTVPVGE
jgi:hypothetical protein